MRKILLGLLFIIVIVVSYLIYTEFSFSPLNKKDFQKLFKGENISFEKSCSKDFVGSSIHGEIFEICRTGTDRQLTEAIKFYDYVEVQPLTVYKNLLQNDSLDEQQLQTII